MIKKILGLLGLTFLVLIAIVLINTFRSRPWPVKSTSITLRPMPDSAIQHLSQAVQIATISISDTSAIDTSAYISFHSFLEKSYPLVHQHLTKTLIRGFSLVYEWKGQNPALAPIVLMGHFDVVPIESAVLDKWVVAPFSGTVTDTCIWGRGSVDDKSGVISIMEAAEAMLRKGFTPKRTIYLCFGHDEETSGRGAAAIAKWLGERNVHPEMVLDEGGEITEEKIKEVHRPIAIIGVAEKGYASFELSVSKEGGHSSKPDKETSIDILAAALYKLRKNPTPSRLTAPAKEFLGRIGSSSDNFVNRMASSNMWLFESTVKGILSQKPEGSAMIHTTIVPTIIKAGIKDNVIPSTASAIVNSRILPGETSKTVEEYIKEMIQDDRVQIRKVSSFGSDPSPATEINSPAFKRIESAVYKTIPNVIPSPYLMIGATDSRHYRAISNGVVNFLPMTDSKGYHGINERLPLRDFQRGINFMMTIIEESNEEFR